MISEYEFIEYTNSLLPIKWILHGEEAGSRTLLPHWHTSLEITYIYVGEIDSFTVNGISYPTSEGSIYIINSAEIHGSISNFCPDLEALTIQIPYEFLSKLIPNFEYKRFVNYASGDNIEVERIRTVLNKFYNILKNEELELLDIRLNRLTYDLIYLLARHWMYSHKSPINSNLNTKKMGQIQSIVSFIQDNYQLELTVELISTNVYLSTNYLNKFFKKHLGISIMKYVQLVRLRKAQKLLLDSERPIHQISELAGFPNEKSFRKIFEEFYGTTPKKYQLELNKKIKMVNKEKG